MGAGKALGGAVAGVAAIPVLVVVAVSGATPPPATPTGPGGGGGGLDPSKIPAQYVVFVDQAGRVCPGITPVAIAAQDMAESSWNPNAASPVADGIAEFTPLAWKTWGKDYDHNGSISVFDPGDAIPAQGHLMCALYAQVGALLKTGAIKGNPLDLAFAAYNAGLGGVEAAGGIPNNGETPAYIANIHRFMALYSLPGGGGGGGGSFPAPSGPFQTRFVQIARSQLGIPYVLGGGDYRGQSNGGFDCSGYTQFVVYQSTSPHLMLPRTAHQDHADSTLQVVANYSGTGSRDAALAKMVTGDIITFNVPTDSAPWGHVGVYIGGGQMIDAPHPGVDVRVDDLRTNYQYQWTAARIPSKYTGDTTAAKAATAAVTKPGTPNTITVASGLTVADRQRKAWS